MSVGNSTENLEKYLEGQREKDAFTKLDEESQFLLAVSQGMPLTELAKIGECSIRVAKNRLKKLKTAISRYKNL